MKFGNMTCNELVELVTDYLEGTLDDATRARFEEHLADCDGCVTYLAQMRRTIFLTGALSEDDLTPPVRDDLLRAFRDWKREQSGN